MEITRHRRYRPVSIVVLSNTCARDAGLRQSVEPALPNDEDGDDDQTSCDEVGGNRPLIQPDPGGGDSMTLPNGGPMTPSVMTLTSIPSCKRRHAAHERNLTMGKVVEETGKRRCFLCEKDQQRESCRCWCQLRHTSPAFQVPLSATNSYSSSLAA